MCNKEAIVLHESNEEFKTLKKEWFKKAENDIHTPDDLAKFADHLLNDYIHDYGTMCYAIAAISVAGAWLGAEVKGITGFQAGCVMWEFIKNWKYQDNETGMRLINFDNMLYPQYEHEFDKKMSKDIWDSIQKKANDYLSEEKHAHPDVIAHWKSIANGVVPFGYTIKEEF